MRFILFLYFFALLPSLLLGQVGNEWLTPGQIYYKIPVAKEGIYKLTQADLVAAGIPVNQLDPRRIQVFHRGVEQAISFQHLQVPANGQFEAGEFFEFYGKKNDGALDGYLYKPASSQPHSLYNLYNDTTYYFLTVNPVLQGKRMSTFSQVNVSGLPTEVANTSTLIDLQTSSYAAGQTASGFVQLTAFDKGEGWSGPILRENTSASLTLGPITNTVTGSGVPQLEVQLLGRWSTSHRAEIYVGQSAASLRLLATQDFFGFEANTSSHSLLWTDISSTGNLLVQVRIAGTGAQDFVSVSYARVSFPRNFSMLAESERSFSLLPSANGKSYIEIQQAPVNVRVFDITDSNNLIQIGTTQTSTTNAVINNTNDVRQILVTNQTITPSSIKRVVFRPFTSTNATFLIISHKNFQRAALGSSNPLKSYASYRASNAGGGFDTLTVTMDQLYNQFTYGESTPLAIFRFLKFIETQRRPDYLFLIGKGLDVQNRYYRNPSAFSENKDFVPVAGTPSSDTYYSVGLSDPNSNEPGIATGRLSATRPEQLMHYLAKVIEHESRGYTDLSKKRILHLSGGIAQGEPETFRSFMEDFGSTAEGLYLGGSVSAIAKQSLQAQELINISDEVNKGLGLITFFGHSSSSTTDFDIGFVTDPQLGYDNKGKYPMLLINGCNAGAFSFNNTLFGEDWVNASERGAVGFVAHSSFGLVSTLKRYSDIFYQVAFGDSTFLKKGIGDVQKETASRFMDGAFVSYTNVSQVQQMVLLGDPAVKIFGATLPDYSIDETSISITSSEGKPVSATTSLLDVKIAVKNFGRAEPKPIEVRLERKLSNNTLLIYDSLFNPIFFQDTLVFRIPNAFSNAGINQMTVKIDYDESIVEMREDNNTVGINFFIPINGTKNLYPQDFAIVNQLQQELIFQSANLLDTLRSFVVEVDTSYRFASAWKKSHEISALLLPKLSVELLPRDSITYYWRTRLMHPGEEESTDWVTSSFTYVVSGNAGWGQLSFPQYLSNTTTDLVFQENSRRIRFDESSIPVLIRTFGDLNPSPITDVSVKIDGVEYNLATQGQPCRDNTINLLSFNRVNTIPYAAIPFNFQDPRTCGREPQVIVSFNSLEVFNNGVNDLVNAIDNIASGDSVILFSIGNPLLATWNSAVANKLSEIGVSLSQITSLLAGEPFVLYGRKGALTGTARLYTASLEPKQEQELIVNKQVSGTENSGIMSSSIIGPAKTWQMLKVNANVEPNEISTVSVLGITLSGVTAVLFEGVTSSLDLSVVDAQQYPLLRLVYSTRDELNLTPSKLSYWLVEYEPLPEGILIPSDLIRTQQLLEGDMYKENFSFINLSPEFFSDSLDVLITTRNRLTNRSEQSTIKIIAPLPKDTSKFSIVVPTLERIGSNEVSISVNPNIQPEMYYDNNVLVVNEGFFVVADNTSPVLSVLVDGRMLQNGDFVSSSPKIDITVWDENRVLLKTDTLGIILQLQYPCTQSCVSTRLYFSRSDVEWFPATSSTPFRIFFNPEILLPGKYTLLINAEDSRGNESGVEPYEITFEVSEDKRWVVSDPYPNPTNGYITFSVISTEESEGKARLELLSPIGNTVYSFQIDASDWHVGTNVISFNLGNTLSAGVYTYRYYLPNGRIKQGRLLLTN